jgi:cell wall-associated NlpC family hydrolase
MPKILTAILLIALSPALACAGQDPAVPGAAVVINTVENMFRTATTDTDVVSQALLGENVKVLNREKAAGVDWCQIETPDAYPGWVVASSLRFLAPGEKAYASAGKVFAVSALLANTYREPDVTAHMPVKVAPISAVLEIAGERNERWLEVVLPSGAKAFVQRGDGDVREAPWTWPRRPVADMIALSKRFLGINYLWGGRSPLGLDCSGFVELIYKMSGVPILRDADIQMTQSGLLEVPKGQEQAGDLIFFGRDIKHISHVGMMIDGESFINDTTYQTPCVRVDSLKVERWAKLYQAARRPK